MKYSTLIAVAVSALVSGLASAGTHATNSRAHAAGASAPLPEVVIRAKRVTEAVEGYVDAISMHDGRSLSKVFTDDALVEFVTDDSGASLTVHADSLLDDAVSDFGLTDGRPRVTNVRVFPTNDSNAVFVQYDIVKADGSSTASRDQLAMVEMRGDKVEKMVNFNAPPATLAHSSACATPRDVVVSQR